MLPLPILLTLLSKNLLLMIVLIIVLPMLNNYGTDVRKAAPALITHRRWKHDVQ